MSDTLLIHWQEHGQPHSALWRSENGAAPPAKVRVVDDTLNADAAYKLACEGTALLYRGDYHNARQLLAALARRVGRKGPKAADNPRDAFHFHRQYQAHKARILGMLLLPFEAGALLPLRRAPEVADACRAAYGDIAQPFVTSLRELQGLVGSWEWRKKGVEIAELNARIFPHYGVYSPLRGEYLTLLQQAPLPAGAAELAFDIGTGSGVIAALLARRGVHKVVATDLSPRALTCAADNLARLGVAERVELQAADLFPAGRAALVVCNPPWVPAKPSSAIEGAVYDPDSRMLRGFLAGLAGHLSPGGEGWLVLSDLAEHLELRSREQLLEWIAGAGLVVIERHDIRPHHPKASDADDPLFAARRREVTSLWRLATAAA